MNWLNLGLSVAVLLGAAAGTALVVRSPSFWLGMGRAVLMAVLPVLLRRMPPEEEAAWRKRVSRGEPDQPPRGHRER